MSKAPYRHSDGTDCYTKDCTLGHYVNSESAIMHGDADMYIVAKTIEDTNPSAVDIFFAPKEEVKKSLFSSKATEAPSGYPAAPEADFEAMSQSKTKSSEIEKKERRKKIVNAVVWAGTIGMSAAGIATGFFPLSLPLIAFAGFKIASPSK